MEEKEQEHVEKEEKRQNKEEKEEENERGGVDRMGRKIYGGRNGK